MKKKAKKSVEKNSAKFSKDSALKALAKRPGKLFDALLKGASDIHQLKKIGECSGGLIRKLIWSGVAKINEDKTIKLVPGIKKTSLPDVDATPVKIRRAEKKEKKAEKVSKVKEAPKKEGKK